MFVADMPNVPDQQTTIVLAQVDHAEVRLQAATNVVKPHMVFEGGCIVVQTTDNKSGWEGGFYPAGAVGAYFSNILHVELDTSKATVSILREPKHGKIIDTGTVGDGPYYEFRANSGYLGSDEASLLIEVGGKSYKVNTKFYVVEKVNDNNFYGAGTAATRCAESQTRRVSELRLEELWIPKPRQPAALAMTSRWY